MRLNPTIRPAATADAESISSLIGRVWSKHFAYSVTTEDLADFLQTKLHPAQIALEIADPDIHFIVAVNSSQTTIGVVQLVKHTTEPGLTTLKHVEIRRLYVDDEYQGKGLARALMVEAQEWAKAEGYGGTWLGVWEMNERAIAFYGKMGYVTQGEHVFYVGSSERRDFVMEKVL